MTTAYKATYFSENAMTVMCTKKYFIHGDQYATCGNCGKRHETEDQFIDRVSLGKERYREGLIEPLRFLPNSPTLFNVGNPAGGTLSACFKFTVDDTMFNSTDGIMPVMMKAAKVLKAGGGVGFGLTKVRAQGSPVNSTHGVALGPLGVMRMYHRVAKEITQGGKRNAAQMAILHCEHQDIDRFIHAKDEDPDALGTFNISVALTDEFMRKATTDATSVEYRRLREMAASAWKTGDPGCYFIDEANRHNPTPELGELDATNPCGEVPLLPNEPCNLGSINVAKFWSGGRFDWQTLYDVAYLATEYLDDILDINVFPDPEIDFAARLTRKLGLGVCGVADLLTLMGIHYDSDEGLEFADKIAAHIARASLHASKDMAIRKGVAPCFEGKDVLLRNATRTCIAPTGTIAIIMNASSGIEPYFAIENTREMSDGTIMIERPWPYERNQSFKPHVANEIAPYWHVQHQATWQNHVDLAVSKTVNMAHDVTPDDVLEAYVKAWQAKCKGVTVYRDGSRDNQVLKAITAEAPAVKANRWREQLPDTRPGRNHRFQIADVKGYIQVGLFDDGSPGEVFIELARAGQVLDGMADWLAHEISVMFQMGHLHGIPFTVFTNKWIGRKFEPSGMTRNPKIPFADSVADYLGKWLNMEFGTPVQQATAVMAEVVEEIEARGATCPECGRLLQFNEGCAHCVCGYEECN